MGWGAERLCAFRLLRQVMTTHHAVQALVYTLVVYGLVVLSLLLIAFLIPYLVISGM